MFPESTDERVLAAVEILSHKGIVNPILVGDKDKIHDAGQNAGIETDAFNICDNSGRDRIDRYAQEYARTRDIKPAVARKLVKKPLAMAGMMVRTNDADGMVAGCVHATATVLQNAAMTIGLSDGISGPSSIFLMQLPDSCAYPEKNSRILVFADAAVAVDPDAQNLSGIGVLAGRNAGTLLGIEPRIAFLSFSTKGSASHEKVDKVKEAVALAQHTAPELHIDGELQADTAIVTRVANKKAPQSPVAGNANVLIFPDLNAGNIAYKLVQYLAGATAIGPILQGFQKPVNDLSRGATVDDVVNVSAITAVQAGTYDSQDA